VIPAALAAGLIGVDDVVHRGVAVELLGRSHPVYKLSVGGEPRAILKCFEARRGETDGEAARERAVAILAAERPALAALVPRHLAWGGGSGVVATEPAEGAVAWSFDRLAGGEEEIEAAWDRLIAALAPRLAAMHRATRDLVREPGLAPPELGGPMPWGLRLFDGDCPAELWATPQLAPLLARLAADAPLIANVRRARGGWRTRCLIHGDLKHDNLLLKDDGESLRVTIVDWEMARLGDPAWDLAALVTRFPTAAGDAPPWPEANLDAAARLVRRYAEASGLPAPALAQRLLLYTGVWLIMTALQYLSSAAADAPADAAEGLAGAGIATLREADPLTAALLARLE
jgi:Ser/Thr protein kinase RdoA (MazF antagonist)